MADQLTQEERDEIQWMKENRWTFSRPKTDKVAVVIHICGDPRCTNPKHLKLVYESDEE